MATEQAMAALKKANEIRVAAAQTKREIRSGELPLSDLLREGIPDHMKSLTSEQLLHLPKRMYRRNVQDFLEAARLSPYQRSTEITTRQRNLLADLVEGWETGMAERQAKREEAAA